MFYSAGGRYEPKAIEQALRHRCQRVHEDEKRVPLGFKKPLRYGGTSSSRPSTSSSGTNAGFSRFRKKMVGPPKAHGAHVAVAEECEDGEDAEEPGDDEDLEQDEAYEAFLQGDDGHGDEAEAEEAGSEDDEPEVITPEELREAYAAGWRAKDQINAKKRGRSFGGGGGPPARSKERAAGTGQDARKASTTCASCGQLGHWKGDPQCPHVQNGTDRPFQPKSKDPPKQRTQFVNFVKQPQPEGVASVLQDQVKTNGLSVHEVNFTFMATRTEQGRSRLAEPKQQGPRPRKETPAAPEGVACPRCEKKVGSTDKFCSECGTSLALVPMTDHSAKRPPLLLEYASEPEAVLSSSESSFSKVTDEGKVQIPLHKAV